MRKLLLLTALLVCAFITRAQVDEKDQSTAMQLVNANQAKLGLSSDDISNLMVQSSYIIQGTNIRMAYMQQTYKGIPVYNKMLVLAFKNGSVVSQAGQLMGSMESRTNNHSGLPVVKVDQALATAFADRKVSYATIAEPVRQANTERLMFGKMGIAHENITAELMWMPSSTEEKTYQLTWQFFIAPNKSSDYWLVRVSADNNTIAGVENLTVYCNWSNEGHSANEHYQKHAGTNGVADLAKAVTNNFVANKQQQKSFDWQYRPFVVNSGIYRVVRYPAESPLHPGGTPATHSNPWTWAPGNATTLRWHDDGVTDFNDTRGNNVLASEDLDNNNVPGLLAVSTTALPDLTFDFTPNFTVAPTQTTPVPNQQFNITNLFYWNNLMHDLTYLYGFDEPSGNFQQTNLGRGGLGNDRVNADAQNPGNCNANFATPVDGTSGRMQMFLCTNTTPSRDGDADNAVIAHEYGHGISNRLTGGPGNSSCLGNSEQMGEGWSDYFGLMYTADWATATPSDGFNNPRGIGTYLFGQAPNGAGIRPTRYSTNFAVNPNTYANLPGQAIPHGVGYIWCTMLWEMTWEIIQTAGINPNLFQVTPSITGGNNIALKLVVEGMRLQPCSPGMVQGRDAILRADTLFFGAQYSCAILRAFARRGLGLGASQGSSGSITDGVPSFNGGGPTHTLTSNVTAQQQLNDIVYTQNITANCEAIVNYTLTDTLPTHVTFVSATAGGTYNAGNRVVSWPVNVAVNATNQYQFTVNIDNGSYFPPVDHINDPVLVSPIPAAWTAATTNAASNWTVSSAQSASAPNSYFVNNVATVADVTLTSTNQFLLPAGASAFNELRFTHRYQSENNFDGGVVEISTNNGGSWTDLGPHIIQNGYNGTLSNAFANPIGGRPAFTGTAAGFVTTIVNLNAFSGQNVKIRFRFGSDNLVAATGWFVDDILLSSKPVVIMNSNLYNASNVLQTTRRNIVDIIPVCTPPVITTEPQNDSLCNNQTAIFSVVVNGFGLTYQWELSTDNGATWNPINGATTPNYVIANATSALNGRRYRVQINSACGATTSNEAVIYVSPVLTHTGVAANPTTVCVPAPSTITGTANGGSVGSYTHTLTGPGTIVQNAPSGSNNRTASFTVTNAPVGVNNYTFTSTDTLGCSVSTVVTLTTSAPPVITVQPVARVICQGTNTTFNVTATGLNLTYQWQLSTDVGSTWNNIPGATANSTAVNGAALSQSGHQYRVIVTSACGTITSNAVTLDVTPNPIHQNLSATPNPVCAPGPVALTGTAVGGTLAGGADIVLASSGVINLAIPDAGAAVTNNITLPAFTFNAAANLKIRVNIAHTWVGDLALRVTSPCGNTIIFDRPGVPAGAVGNSANLSGVYIFDIGAATIIPEVLGAATIPAGSYIPSDVPGAAHTWAGVTFPCAGAGTWTISLQDFAGGDIGTLTEWAILGPAAVGQYTHTMTGPGTIVQNPSTGGPSNPTANFTASNLPAGAQVYNLTTTDSRGCSTTSPINVTVNPRPNPVIVGNNMVQQTLTFNSTGGAMRIPATGTSGITNPYPSTITTSGVPATATVASVRLNGVSHTFPSDIDILLQSPNGTNVVLMSDAGSGTDIVNVNYTFQDGAPAMTLTVNPTGTYSPFNSGATDTWVAPGPGSVTQATPLLSLFTPGLVHNGDWKLFVVDDVGGDTGVLNNWSITFTYPAIELCQGSSTQLGILDTTTTRTSTTPITIPALGTATPYPGTLAVSGLPNFARVRSVTLTGMSHTFPADVDILLQSPNGTNVILMSDVGGGTAINNVNYTFQDGFPALGAGANPTGTYSPTNAAGPDNFPAPGPGNVTIVNPTIASFNTSALTPNGTWNLFAIDDLGGDQGSITSWSITFDVPGATTITYTWSPATGLSSTTGNPVTASPTSNIVYTVNAVSNFGCTSASPASMAVNILALPAITVQPTPATQTICPGYTVNYSVTATGAGITYQWRKNGVNMVNGGNVSGATSATLTLTNVSAADAATYTVVVSGTCPPAVTSSGAVLQIGTQPTITTQPLAATSVCQRSTATISVVATALPPIQIYQWQVSTDGGTTWTNLANSASGASPFYNNVFSATLTIGNAPLSISGNRYRVVITTQCGFTINSNASVLTVNPTPTVATTPVTQRVCISDTLVLLSGTPAGGVWSGPGIVPGTNQFLPYNTAVGVQTVKYKVTNQPSGCADSANVTINVEACPERIRTLPNGGVVLFPNPNNGQFNIRVNSTLYNYLGMKVFTSAGALVKHQRWSNLPYGRVLPIDLRHLAAAVYVVYIYYEDGVRTSETSFKVVIASH
jgi:subtilisin-like proprotein convertase family protein